MYPWMIFILIIFGIIGLVKLVELISYTICWMKADNEIKEKLLNKKVTDVVKENKKKESK